MSDLPYLRPEKDYFYNLGILMIIIGKLAKTKRSKLVLSIDKLQTFYFLVTRPVFLNKVLSLAGKKQFVLSHSDFHTVETISPNIDELFNRSKTVTLLKSLSIKGFLVVSFNEKDGFLFELNDTGKEKLEALTGGYYNKINGFVQSLANLQSESSTKLNSHINTILKQG